ncbi:type II toxin-antitoxin system RelB/DinJ family antitoxin [Lactovum odontotermitis]
MAKTANLYARIEPNIKERAEEILEVLGIPASSAINMFYKQIILQHGIPFDVKIPADSVPNVERLSKEALNSELEKGYAQMLEGKSQPAETAFSELRKDYHL